MRRGAWTTGDAILWWSVLAVCAAAYLMHLDAVASGQLAWLPMTLESASEGAAPRVAFIRPDVPEQERTRIEVGDAVRSLEGESLLGEGGLGTALSLYAAAGPERRFEIERVRDPHESERVELSLVRVAHVWRASALALSFLAIGALTYRRAPRRTAARLFFLAAAGYALHWSYFFGGPSHARNFAAIATFGAGVAIALPFGLSAALAFPEDVARRSAAARALPWGFALAGAGAVTWAFGGPLPARAGLPIAVGGSVLFFATLAAVLFDQWRRTGPIGRRQIKWVLLGAIAASMPPLLAGAAAVARPDIAWLYEFSLVSLVLIPLAIFVALVRDHFLDVDRLLTTTSIASLLAAVLLASVIAVVPSAAQAVEHIVEPSVSQPALALAAAGILLAVYNRARPWLEQRLFPERDALESGAEELRRDLASSEKPKELFDALGEGLARRLRLESVVVYGRAADVFAPLFDRGGAMAPAFAASGPLVAMLEQASRIVDSSTLETRLGGASRADLDLRALEAMGTELLLPVHRDGLLEAFACIGERRSGGAFGASELALLQSVADKAADELHRFDREQLHEVRGEMVRRLRRYVPAAVAERLAERADMPTGELDVTLLFVDLRGYTGLSQQHGPARTFDLVSRYTEAVSRIVRDRGGSIVDFQGDGLMAVFGAPDPLPDKERAAVASALEVVERIHTLPIDPRDASLGAPDLGVGIASGSAFAGPIRGVDRTIWGVLGDTTNLAARLQGMAKELNASIVIDDATFARTGELTHAFVLHRDTAIRGRRGRIDLHALSRSSPPATQPPEAS